MGVSVDGGVAVGAGVRLVVAGFVGVGPDLVGVGVDPCEPLPLRVDDGDLSTDGTAVLLRVPDGDGFAVREPVLVGIAVRVPDGVAVRDLVVDRVPVEVREREIQPMRVPDGVNVFAGVAVLLRVTVPV